MRLTVSSRIYTFDNSNLYIHRDTYINTHTHTHTHTSEIYSEQTYGILFAGLKPATKYLNSSFKRLNGQYSISYEAVKSHRSLLHLHVVKKQLMKF